jgi:hypothetical protein
MRRRKQGTLRSGRRGKGGRVKSQRQAIAIGLSEAWKLYFEKSETEELPPSCGPRSPQPTCK